MLVYESSRLVHYTAVRSEGKHVTGALVIGRAKFLCVETKITDKCTFSEGNNKQNKQCTCNLTLWCFYITTFALEIQLLHYTIVELYVTQLYTNNTCHTTMLLWCIYVAGSNKIYIGLHVKCQTFLSYLIHVRIFWTDFCKCAQYQSSQKAIQLESHWYVWTDGQKWQIYISFLLFVWMCLKNCKTETSSHNLLVTNLPP
jgi:hypothetical protein